MARLFTVKKARKAQGPCRKCGEPIEAGTAYKYADKRLSGHGFASTRYKWHEGCPVRQSELMSGFAGEIQAIVESVEEEMASSTCTSDLQTALECGASAIQDLASETREKFDNMPEGFQQGDTGQLLESRADALDEWGSELENAAQEMEEDKEEGVSDEEWLEGRQERAQEAVDSFWRIAYRNSRYLHA